MNYFYENKINSPNLDGIHSDVASSAMTDKAIEWCRWDKATENLKVVFTNSLSAEDKTLLDTVISNNS